MDVSTSRSRVADLLSSELCRKYRTSRSTTILSEQELLLGVPRMLLSAVVLAVTYEKRVIIYWNHRHSHAPQGTPATVSGNAVVPSSADSAPVMPLNRRQLDDIRPRADDIQNAVTAQPSASCELLKWMSVKMRFFQPARLERFLDAVALIC